MVAARLGLYLMALYTIMKFLQDKDGNLRQVGDPDLEMTPEQAEPYLKRGLVVEASDPAARSRAERAMSGYRKRRGTSDA